MGTAIPEADCIERAAWLNQADSLAAHAVTDLIYESSGQEDERFDTYPMNTAVENTRKLVFNVDRIWPDYPELHDAPRREMRSYGFSCN
jgi:hypothetical protein